MAARKNRPIFADLRRARVHNVMRVGLRGRTPTGFGRRGYFRRFLLSIKCFFKRLAPVHKSNLISDGLREIFSVSLIDKEKDVSDLGKFHGSK